MKKAVLAILTVLAVLLAVWVLLLPMEFPQDPTDIYVEVPFADYTDMRGYPNHLIRNDVIQGFTRGVFLGNEENRFYPDDPLASDSAAAWLGRVHEKAKATRIARPIDFLTGKTGPDDLARYIAWSKANGFYVDTENGLSRGDLALMVHRYLLKYPTNNRLARGDSQEYSDLESMPPELYDAVSQLSAVFLPYQLSGRETPSDAGWEFRPELPATNGYAATVFNTLLTDLLIRVDELIPLESYRCPRETWNAEYSLSSRWSLDSPGAPHLISTYGEYCRFVEFLRQELKAEPLEMPNPPITEALFSSCRVCCFTTAQTFSTHYGISLLDEKNMTLVVCKDLGFFYPSDFSTKLVIHLVAVPNDDKPVQVTFDTW